MSAVLKFELEFVTDTCITCGINFAVPRAWNRRRRHDHTFYYCPNGHQQGYVVETQTEKLKKELERERQKTIAAQLQTRMEREAKEKLERKIKRTEKGVCPHCNRHFTNVERHMKSKHVVDTGLRSN